MKARRKTDKHRWNMYTQTNGMITGYFIRRNLGRPTKIRTDQ